jgi:hypothetical protein
MKKHDTAVLDYIAPPADILLPRRLQWCHATPYLFIPGTGPTAGALVTGLAVSVQSIAGVRAGQLAANKPCTSETIRTGQWFATEALSTTDGCRVVMY